jgi:hypothetical protein
MKLTRYFLLGYVSLMPLVLTSGCGIATQRLYRSCSGNDPEVAGYHAVYAQGNSIAVSYSLKSPTYSHQVRLGELYWAQLNTPDLSDDMWSHAGESLHRSPLPAEIARTWKPLPVTPLHDVDSHGYFVWDYLKRLPPNKEPEIYREDTWLYIRYTDPTGKVHFKHFCPGGQAFVLPGQYPKLVLLYPFAVVGDVITMPFVFFLTPRWR